MIFGNKGDTSATGVAFTRNPANGDKEFYGDYLVNAQGEDVVAGIRNTSPIADLKNTPGLEEAGKELEGVFTLLENHFRDMCDIEFTIEQGKLWMLQTRVGKSALPPSALHIAIAMVEEGLITKEEAVMRVDPRTARSAPPPAVRCRCRIRCGCNWPQRISGCCSGRSGLFR